MRPLLPLVFLLCACASSPDPERGWVPVGLRHGIEVFVRGLPDTSLPRVRGEAVIEADLLLVLAVLADVHRSAEWVPLVVEARYLEAEPSAGVWIYQRGRAPIPANLFLWDRDVVVHSELIEEEPNVSYRVNFQAAEPERVKLPPKVVRMPRMNGFSELIRLGPRRTRVIFEVELDAGGSLPPAAEVYAVRELPFDSLYALRQRVGEVAGDYEELVERWRKGGVDLRDLR
jgi:hypothetical protein